MIYLYCMVAMCEISLKHQKEAQKTLGSISNCQKQSSHSAAAGSQSTTPAQTEASQMP